jgi:uncharacterized protein YkwD
MIYIKIYPIDIKAIFLLFTLTCITFSASGPELDQAEAKSVFLMLNKIRSNPKAYRNTFQQFEAVQPKPQLKWNDTLARVMEAKALDMATRNYFAHVDQDGYGIN